MARTVAARRPALEDPQDVSDTPTAPPAAWPPLRNRRKWRGKAGEACGFCTVLTRDGVHHDKCKGENHTNPGKKDDHVWTCSCAAAGHLQEG